MAKRSQSSVHWLVLLPHLLRLCLCLCLVSHVAVAVPVVSSQWQALQDVAAAAQSGTLFGWTSATAECTGGALKGVSCDDAGLVTALDLSYYWSLGGSLSASVTNLSSLRSLKLLGTFASGGQLPSGWSSFTALSFLNLHYNRFSGPLPADLSSVSTLQYLDLSMNNFTGTGIAAITSLQRLLSLNLYYNPLLQWTIPSNIGVLSQLTFLDLSYTATSGILPSNLSCTLPKLVDLRISGTYITGPAPSTVSPNMVNLYLNNAFLYATGALSLAPNGTLLAPGNNCRQSVMLEKNCLAATAASCDSLLQRDSSACAAFCGTGVGANAAPYAQCGGGGTCVAQFNSTTLAFSSFVCLSKDQYSPVFDTCGAQATSNGSIITTTTSTSTVSGATATGLSVLRRARPSPPPPPSEPYASNQVCTLGSVTRCGLSLDLRKVEGSGCSCLKSAASTTDKKCAYIANCL